MSLRQIHLGVMEPFRILDHTADVGFEAFGTTLEEVFANAGRALANLFVDLDSVEPRQEALIQTRGRDLGGLLVNFLSEILFLEDAEGWLFRDFEAHLSDGPAINANARGEKFDRSRHQAKMLVKAVTYHQLLLEQISSGWRAQVYVDI
ncbi:MAG: archease [Terriglobia bacterium]